MGKIHCANCGEDAVVIEDNRYYCAKCWMKLFKKVVKWTRQ